jgi:DNA polymerase III alpha subunit
MKTNQYGEMIFDQEDLCDLLMQGHDLTAMSNFIVDRTVDLEKCAEILDDPGCTLTWSFVNNSDHSVPEFDLDQQSNWHMPDEYKSLDIAEYVINLCTTQDQLQRIGQELLLFQKYNLFDLLRYLKYLVDVMRNNHLIWGVGRGSSTASYVLYLLGVHRIDSLHYNLDPTEFLR